MTHRTLSLSTHTKFSSLIPGGVNSPVRSFYKVGMDPMIVSSGKGSRITDLDGKEYIDYCMSWGALILGHAHPRIVDAACDAVRRGSTFGITTEIEGKIAEKVLSHLPSLEKIRFVSSGTEATMTAIRLARGYTGRQKIIKFAGHYHGHFDPLLVQAGSGVASLNAIATSKGVGAAVIADTIVFPFNDLEGLRTFFRTNPMAKEVAAVILEPVTANMGVVLPKEGFLKMLREETERVGALLIFDEVVTGFRLGLEGAQGQFGIDPDLTCLGKVVGGGFPAAAVGGKAKIMNCLAPLGEVYQAGTLSGNPVAMHAGFETLCLVEEPGFYEELERKQNLLTGQIRGNVRIEKRGSMFSLFFENDARFGAFFRHLFERGIYIPPAHLEAWFVSSAHTDEEIDYTVECINSFF